MDYIISLILPPLGVWRSQHKLQVLLSLVLWGLAIMFVVIASNDGPAGTYAAGPVLYMFSIIHAFILTHRHLQTERGSRHPHQGQ
ncbi:hypothetical protein [Aliidiomarina sp. B3213]|uniref:hypothetical protein n=1 Tax=Aliidiomarina sp. B3213 TaxID=2249757 RepID=UPI000DD07052|nr:hypothetical protein [Aliidiomarina sp. B3213]RTE85891.1 hypothetical protein DQX04_10615 [Aliidiomarina sp. B3213]